MDTTQLARWKQLSLGLARTAWPNLTAARRAALLKAIDDFIEDLIAAWPLAEICSWDGHPGKVYVCDAIDDFLWDRGYILERGDEPVRGRFGDMVAACVRAGFDVAVSPSAGVLGFFTVGHLRVIFDGHMPDWVRRYFEPPLPEDAPDDAEVWL